mmetsp:Transcript_29000/g.56777  ORF Transcript_29000/g.56777 Transcript_29000/m.56777 type:complete len:114 (-) Transcript_29000:41-382(-)
MQACCLRAPPSAVRAISPNFPSASRDVSWLRGRLHPVAHGRRFSALREAACLPRGFCKTQKTDSDHCVDVWAQMQAQTALAWNEGRRRARGSPGDKQTKGLSFLKHFSHGSFV